MPVLRLLFVVLILLNVLALASMRGWLGTSVPQGEPERLSNQLNADRIVLRPGNGAAAGAPAAPAAAPAGTAAVAEGNPAQAAAAEKPAAAAQAAEACIAFAGLTEDQAENLVKTALAGHPELRHERKTGATPSAWWVRIPPSGGREAAERRVAELRTLGISDLFIVNDPGPHQYSVSLGLFKTEAKAQQHLAYLQSRHVRGASVAARSAVVHRIEVRGPAAALDALTTSRPARGSGATISECTP